MCAHWRAQEQQTMTQWQTTRRGVQPQLSHNFPKTLPKLSQNSPKAKKFAYGWAQDYGNCLLLSSPQLQSNAAAVAPTR